MRRIALAVVIVVVLAGCTAYRADGEIAPIAPSTATTPTPEEDVDSDPVALQLSVSGVAAVDASGAVLDQVEFDQPVADVVLFIEETLGESATILQRDIDPCSDATGITSYSWTDHGVGVSFVSNPSRLATWREPNSYRVSFGDATLNGIELRGAEGIRVGDDATVFVAAMSADQVKQVSSNAVWAIFEAGGTYTNSELSGSWGLAAIVEGGIVTNWSSPSYLLDAQC